MISYSGGIFAGSQSQTYFPFWCGVSVNSVLLDAGNFPNSWDFGTIIGMTFQSLGNSQNPLKSGNFGICCKNGHYNSKSKSKIKNTLFQGLFNVFLGKYICFWFPIQYIWLKYCSTINKEIKSYFDFFLISLPKILEIF